MLSTKNMTRQEWLKARKMGLGGSDIASVFGYSNYDTPFQLYLDKIDPEVPEEEEQTDLQLIGTLQEETVATLFTHKTGFKVQHRWSIFQHKDHPFLLANIDRYVIGEKALLECKTAHLSKRNEWGEIGTDEIPYEYLMQVTHYMTVTGLRIAYVAVLIAGSEFRWYKVNYNERLANGLIAGAKTFWEDHVQKRVPPPPVDLADLKVLYDLGNGLTITATPEIVASVDGLISVKDEIKGLEKQKEAYEFTVKEFMGENEMLLAPDDGFTLATWKMGKEKRGNFLTKKRKSA